MQDPYFAVKEEVEHSVTVVVDLHKRWEELSQSKKKSDEWEWTASELLSGLRSIEWDLQDLEDTVSIVEGNRQKFQLEEADVQERKDFISSTRNQIVALRDEVQGAAMTPGFATAKSGGPKMPSIGSKGKGYGKVGSQDDAIEMMPAHDDVEVGGNGSAPLGHRTSNEDEILGAEPDSGHVGLASLTSPPRGRHRKKKLCLCVCVLMLLLGGGVVGWLTFARGGGAAGDNNAVLPDTAAAAAAAAPTTGGDVLGASSAAAAEAPAPTDAAAASAAPSAAPSPSPTSPEAEAEAEEDAEADATRRRLLREAALPTRRPAMTRVVLPQERRPTPGA